jgi:LEA14-like dessication related protein
MKKIIKRISILFLVFIGISAASIFIFREDLRTYFIPTVKPLGEIHIKIRNDTSYVNSKLIIQNRSFLKLGIDTIKFKVTLFDKVYLKNTKFLGITLNGKDTDTIDFSLKIPYKEIINDLKTERRKGDSADYSIDVSLQYSTFLGRSEMPISKVSKIKIPQPPELKIIEVKYKKIRRKAITAEVKIKITNYNSIALTIKEMSYSLNVLKQGNMKGALDKKINIKAKGTTFIYLPITITPKHVARTIFDVLINKDNYEYTLSLKASLESTDPVDQLFDIDLTKSGKMELRK